MSALTHFIAFLGVFFGFLVLLYISTYPVVKPLHIITFSIFGVSMMMVYAASTVYHTLFLSEKGIKRLKKIDHMMIFVSIASTYTPICLIALKGFWGVEPVGNYLGSGSNRHTYKDFLDTCSKMVFFRNLCDGGLDCPNLSPPYN